MTEAWKPVVGFEEEYEVSDLGRVRSLTSNGPYGRRRRIVPKLITARTRRVRNYPVVDLCSNCRRVTRDVHLLILEAFVGPRPTGMQGRHLNGQSLDCRLSNLAWGTREENQLDKRRHGTNPEGIRHPLAKFTDAMILEIRTARAAGETLQKLADKFHVSRSAIGLVSTGDRWPHIGGPLTRGARRGERHQCARLTDGEVISIRHAHSAGLETISQLAARHGVSQPAICGIVSGDKWRHLLTNHVDSGEPVSAILRRVK